MILTHWPRWLPRKRSKPATWNLHFFANPWWFESHKKKTYCIAFLSLDSMFPYLRLVCATAILVGWLRRLHEASLTSFCFHKALKILVRWIPSLKLKVRSLNISRNPKGPSGSNLPTSPSVTIKLRVETFCFGGVKNLKTDQTQSCFLGWAPWKPSRAFCWGMWRWWWPWRRATWQDFRWNSPPNAAMLAFFHGFSYNHP